MRDRSPPFVRCPRSWSLAFAFLCRPSRRRAAEHVLLSFRVHSCTHACTEHVLLPCLSFQIVNDEMLTDWREQIVWDLHRKHHAPRTSGQIKALIANYHGRFEELADRLEQTFGEDPMR